MLLVLFHEHMFSYSSISSSTAQFSPPLLHLDPSFHSVPLTTQPLISTSVSQQSNQPSKSHNSFPPPDMEHFLPHPIHQIHVSKSSQPSGMEPRSHTSSSSDQSLSPTPFLSHGSISTSSHQFQPLDKLPISPSPLPPTVETQLPYLFNLNVFFKHPYDDNKA